MEDRLNQVADQAMEQPGVTGYICVDDSGLCVTSRGQAKQSISGIVRELSRLVSKIDDNSITKKQNPVIRVDLDRYKLTIQAQEDLTVGLISAQTKKL